MSWRAEWGGEVQGRRATREEAQALVAGCLHAMVTNETTGERWLRHADGTWAETVRALVARKLTDPETWPKLPERKDIDG